MRTSLACALRETIILRQALVGGHCRFHDVESTDNDAQWYLGYQSDSTARASPLSESLSSICSHAHSVLNITNAVHTHTALPPIRLASIRLVFRDEAWMFSFERVPAANLTTENLFESLLHLGISPCWRRWRDSSTGSLLSSPSREYPRIGRWTFTNYGS